MHSLHSYGVCACSEPTPSIPRKVPCEWDNRQRKCFSEIATRAYAERCAGFSLVAIGLGLYVENASLGKAQHEQDNTMDRLAGVTGVSLVL